MAGLLQADEAVFVPILPSFERFHERLVAGTKAQTSRAGADAGRGFNQGFGNAIGGRGGGGGLMAVTSKVVAPLAALFAAGKVKDFIASSIGEAREAQQVGARTEAQIRATGGAAKVSAADIGRLSESLSAKTGVDDEAIQSGANLLLGFKNIRNETGRGNQAFNRATTAALNLSKAGFGSMTATSRLMGRSLNDPIKGMTALSRVGVKFTDEQKEQITTLVKHGRTLDAQKIILKAVEDRVGGVAARSATMGEKLTVSFNNFKEKAGNLLLPILDRLFGFLVRTGIPALNRFVGYLEKNGPAAFRSIRAAIAPAIPVLSRVVSAVGQVFGAFTREGPGASRFLRGQFLPLLSGIVSSSRRLAAVVLPILRQILAAFIREWPKIRPVVRQIFGDIWIIVRTILVAIRTRTEQITAGIRFIWSRWGNQIIRLVTSAFRMVLDVIRGVMRVVRGVVEVFTGLMTGDFRKAGSGIGNIVRGLAIILSGVFRGIGRALSIIFGGIVTNLLNKARDLRTRVVSAFRQMMSDTAARIHTGMGAIGRAFDQVREKAKVPIRFVVNTVLNDGILAAVRKISDVVGFEAGKNLRVSAGFARGGYTGPGSRNDVAGTVHRGEFVFPKDIVDRLGVRALYSWMDVIRRGLLTKPGDIGLPGYSVGGYVKALGFARRQVGEPYVFGGVGPYGFDCSGITSAIQNVIEDMANPYVRRHSTTSFAGGGDRKAGFVRNMKSPFMVGVDTRPGRFGHMAGTLLGINVESAGGVGVRMGGSARGYNNSYFPTRWGYAGPGAGGKILEFLNAGFNSIADWFGSLVSKPLGRLNEIRNNPLGRMAASVPSFMLDAIKDKLNVFDTGIGDLPPGLSLAFNGTGRPERLFSEDRLREMTSRHYGHLHNYAGAQIYAVNPAELWRAQIREERKLDALVTPSTRGR